MPRWNDGWTPTSSLPSSASEKILICRKGLATETIGAVAGCRLWDFGSVGMEWNRPAGWRTHSRDVFFLFSVDVRQLQQCVVFTRHCVVWGDESTPSFGSRRDCTAPHLR
mmetsp:Transcript_21180/g.44545  ORF Transcript_21180/g.44545 Transcript_21180/m.44545 type:complete len:110 (+) Transcript_21180:396-725(+)